MAIFVIYVIHAVYMGSGWVPGEKGFQGVVITSSRGPLAAKKQIAGNKETKSREQKTTSMQGRHERQLQNGKNTRSAIQPTQP